MLGTEYLILTVIVFSSGDPVNITSLIIKFGKLVISLLLTSSLRKSKLSSFICSNKNSLNPPPNPGFKYLSPGFVKKKFIRPLFIASFVW